ncbi:MAG: D-2-hydroxyacid dehydrogenase [Clostridia bacterium]|jgi:glycerate dehydrogenase|nr:D-2-hydroxyacid dehydrogenase [Clostridia bacterium]MBT7122587.1 D-2-hydroxyacid dehydrogenase [Clostridia bacterium]
MKIVVLDGYTLNPGDLSWEGLEKLGDLTVYERTPAEKTIERIGDASIVYTNKTVISKEVLDACPAIEWIGVLATGYNVVDVEHAQVKGIPVCNVPTYGTTAVAQMVFALLLELCHHVGEHEQTVKAGDWSKSIDFCYWNTPLVELSGKTMGIVGLGKIGQATAKIAQAFGMNILAYDEYKHTELQSSNLRYTRLVDLLKKSDVISLHCPLFSSTEGMINAKTIAMMKDGVMIINTSRGGLIVEEDLRDALNSGKVAGAACDVVSTEPIGMDNALLGAKNIVITPHIAWAPKESRERLMAVAVSNLVSHIGGETVNAVNV